MFDYFSRGKLFQFMIWVSKHFNCFDDPKMLSNDKQALITVSFLWRPSKNALNTTSTRENQVKMNALDNLIQNRLKNLQNPRNCSEAKKIICNFKITCGYGCLIHHAVYCFILAYATQRMLVIKSDKGNEAFFDHDIFKNLFQPLSLSCENLPNISAQDMVTWGSENANEEVNVILHIARERPTSTFLPCAIPRDIADDLLTFHNHPCAWWVGQFVKFLLRPNSKYNSTLSTLFKAAFKQRPVVGVHIRRTDKAKTDKLHPVSSYMSRVDKLLGGSQKRIYLASDDPAVFDVTRDQYSDIIVFGDQRLSLNADPKKRKSAEAFYEFFTTIFTLARCDFLVCTFSSNVCRLIYELRQCEDYDAVNKTVSLDMKWLFHSGTNRDCTIADFPID